MTRRQFISTAARTALGAGAMACSACAPTVEPLFRVGATVWPGYEPLFLARAMGFLDGQPIKLVEYSSTPEAMRSFKNGALEAIGVTGDEFLRLAAEEKSLKAFLITDFSDGADALIARGQYDCVRKLEGKKVAVEVNATGVFVLTRALAAVGMNRKEIEIVPLENDQHLEAFQNGAIDAAVTFEPHRTKLLKAGGRVLFDSSRMPGEVTDFLVTREETLNARLERLKAIAAAWFKARQAMIDKPREAAAMIAEREGLSVKEFMETLKLIRTPDLEENRRLLTSEKSELMTGLGKMHQVLRDYGHFAAAAPRLELFTTRALP